MNSEVSALWDDSGELLRVTGAPDSPNSYWSLSFEFANGVLTLMCDQDTDEVSIGVGQRDPTSAEVRDGWSEPLLGKVIEHAWELRNHRGYTDGFQLRLLDLDTRENPSIQFEVLASTLHVRRVIAG